MIAQEKLLEEFVNKLAVSIAEKHGQNVSLSIVKMQQFGVNLIWNVVIDNREAYCVEYNMATNTWDWYRLFGHW